MLSFARVCFLAVSLSLLLNVSVAANLQFAIYNGTTCSGNSVSSGTDNSPTYQSASGQNAWVGSCTSLSNVASGFNYILMNCGTGNTNVDTVTLWGDNGCKTTPVASGSGAGSGKCTTITTTQTGVSISAIVTCNSAYAMAALSLPLLALLALLATISM